MRRIADAIPAGLPRTSRTRASRSSQRSWSLALSPGTVEQMTALLDAATDLDARKQARTAGRRGFMATLTFAGLRIHEAAGLKWDDVDLACGRITVNRSKTTAGERVVDVLAVL